MYTIGQLSKQFNLSRSTLLYYSKTRLLCPSQRTEAGYRLYTEEDKNRLEKICLYKKMGLKLERINEILNKDPLPALEERLVQLNDEVNNIRAQQKTILKMIESPNADKMVEFFTPQRFGNLLKMSGMSEMDTNLFHVNLEKSSPEEHRMFLKFLGLDDEKCDDIIQQVRAYIKSQEKS